MQIPHLRDLLISWAEINSGSSNIAGLERMRAALAADFGALPAAELEPVALAGTEAKALRLRVRPHVPKQILLSGHYDTVYGPEQPFQHCTLLDEKTLRGPGVADMKGGLVVIFAALREFERSPHAAAIGYEILLTPDEETGSVASRPVIESAARSGRFAFALVFEPARANGNLVKSRKGTGVFVITVHGRAAHAGRDPSTGRNAILALAELLPQVDALKGQLDGVMINIGRIRGGGPVNIVPDFAEAQVDIRITRAVEARLVPDRLHALAAPINSRDGYRVEIAGGFNRLPKEVTPTEEKLFAAWQACGAALGMNFSWQHTGGGSDGNLLSTAGLPNLDGLGPVGDGVHSPEEQVHLPSLVDRARLAARFLENFAAGKIDI